MFGRSAAIAGESVLRAGLASAPTNGLAKGSVSFLSKTGMARRPVYTAAERSVATPYLTPVSPGKPLIRTALESKAQFIKSNFAHAGNMRWIDIPNPIAGCDFFYFAGVLWATGVNATNSSLLVAVLKAGADLLGVGAQTLADEFSIKNLNVEGEKGMTKSQLVHENINLHDQVFVAAKEVTELFNLDKTVILITSHPKNEKLPRENVEQLVEKHGGEIVDRKKVTNIISAANEGDDIKPHDSETITIVLPNQKTVNTPNVGAQKKQAISATDGTNAAQSAK